MNKKFFLPSLAAIFTAALFIKNSELTARCVQSGLETCFLTVIPSLFPFMVISEVLCECGALDFLGRLQRGRAASMWGLSRKSFAAVFAGLLFGFPIGTRALASLYDKGEISEDELSRAVGFCGIPSFGFIVGVMGTGFFASKSFGVFMYAVAVGSALLSGMIFRKGNTCKYELTSSPSKSKSFSAILTGAISSSTGAIITLCAYIVFFSCVVGCVSASFDLGLTGKLAAVFFELTAGIKAGSSTGGAVAAALCGFCIGWSGLSVHFQTIALVSTRIKSFATYFLQKLFQGVICSVAAILFSTFSGLEANGGATEVFSSLYAPEYTVIVFLIFFFCLFHSKKYLFKTENP